MFFYFPLPTKVGGENSFFFADTTTCAGLFAASEDQAQWPGARHPARSYLCPLPRDSSPTAWGHLCPWRTEGMKLASKEKAILERWRWNPPTKKSQTQTWEQQGLVSALCQAPGAALPWGTARWGWAEEVLGRGMLPPTSLGSARSSQLVPTAVGRSRLWPANVHWEQETGYGAAWQINDVNTDAVALSGVWGEACTIMKLDHAPHHTRVQRYTHRLARLMSAEGLISHILPPRFTHSWRERLAWGAACEASEVHKHNDDFNRNHVTSQQMFPSEVRGEAL